MNAKNPDQRRGTSVEPVERRYKRREGLLPRILYCASRSGPRIEITRNNDPLGWDADIENHVACLSRIHHDDEIGVASFRRLERPRTEQREIKTALPSQGK